MEGTGPLCRKKIIFRPQNDKFKCSLTQFLTGTVLEHGFYGSITKRNLQNGAKIIQKVTIRQGGAVAPSPPPPLNTPLLRLLVFSAVCLNEVIN